MEKFNNKYRIKSNRLKGWDYSSNGFYFITIATHLKKPIFGSIKNQSMLLSKFGEITQSQWHHSFVIRKELNLHNFILMPNHLHAIIEIYNEPDCRDARPCVSRSGVSTGLLRKTKSISSFVAGFKSSVVNKIDDYIDFKKLPIEKFNRNNPL